MKSHYDGLWPTNIRIGRVPRRVSYGMDGKSLHYPIIAYGNSSSKGFANVLNSKWVEVPQFSSSSSIHSSLMSRGNSCKVSSLSLTYYHYKMSLVPPSFSSNVFATFSTCSSRKVESITKVAFIRYCLSVIVDLSYNCIYNFCRRNSPPNSAITIP